jgi:uncharacterized membrane protein YkoI
LEYVGDLEKLMFDRRALLLGAATGLGLADHALAEGDHDAARRALQNGEIRPLLEILDTLRPELGGEVIEVNFKGKRRARPHVYEFKVLNSDGRLSEVTVDAATAKIIKREAE